MLGLADRPFACWNNSYRSLLAVSFLVINMQEEVAATRLQAHARGMSARSLLESNREMRQETREAKRLLKARQDRAKLEREYDRVQAALQESDAALLQAEQEKEQQTANEVAQLAAKDAAEAARAARLVEEEQRRRKVEELRALERQRLEEARLEAASRRRQRLAKTAKLRQAARVVMMTNHMTVAASHTRYGFIGLSSGASSSLIGAICGARNAPNGVVSLAAKLDGDEADSTEGRRSSGAEEDPCLLYTSPSPRDRQKSRMPSSA